MTEPLRRSPALSRRALLGGAATAVAIGAAASGCSRSDEPLVRPAGVPLSPFDADTTAAEVVAGLDLSGKTYLVTGGTSGLGMETARVLAAQGADVLVTGRTEDRARDAAQQIGGRCTGLELELAAPTSVVACAQLVDRLGVALDGLICNAGIMRQGERRILEGIEEHFAVNHLGHFLLVRLLLPRVRAAPQGRIVVVSSSAWKWAPPSGIDFDDLAGRRDYSANKAYGQSKLANALFAAELARRLAGTTTTANAVNPGPVDTALWRYAPAWQRTLLAPVKGLLLKPVEVGAATQAYVATAPALASVSGQCFQDCNPFVPPPYVQDAALSRRLWDVSEAWAEPYLS
jgi:NAD(P)-dependent dehydrogenase (short-subunit alcohol dehydrogenase family)